jgi:hypothetical protein
MPIDVKAARERFLIEQARFRTTVLAAVQDDRQRKTDVAADAALSRPGLDAWLRAELPTLAGSAELPEQTLVQLSDADGTVQRGWVRGPLPERITWCGKSWVRQGAHAVGQDAWVWTFQRAD